MTDPHGRAAFERLRKEAKRWLRTLQSGDEAALQRLDQKLERHSEPPVLREVQQALAREQGFSSWAALKEHHTLVPGEANSPAELLELFLEHACIFTPPTDFTGKWRRADRLLARHPEIAKASVHTAVVCGKVEHVRALLDAEPEQIKLAGGPQRWQPLLFACYGRLPSAAAPERSLEMATLLLERGADPNAHFVTNDDLGLRFTALTGTLGQGEMGQPEHACADALARLLLEWGADPNDGQGLYNTHLVGDDTRWLELLSSYGLGPDAPINWHADPAAAEKSGADRAETVFGYLLAGAAKNGHSRRLAWLLEHGADPDAKSIYDGLSCYQHAVIQGNADSVQKLLQHGATVARLEGHDAFVAAARSGDRQRAAQLLALHPQYEQTGDPLTDAAQRGEADVILTLLELGVDPNATSQHGHRALHNACENREVSLLLLRHGADPKSRAFGGTACEWAIRAGNLELARFHAEHSRSLLDAAMSGHVTLARELLENDPALVEQRSPAGNQALHELTSDPALAESLVRVLLSYGADARAQNDAGQTPRERLEERGADQVADLIDTISEP